MRLSDPVLVDRLAASYVLGSLAGGARRRFARLMRDRADVRLAVRDWEARLGTPAPRVWQAIEEQTRSAGVEPARPGGRRMPIGSLLAGLAAALALAAAIRTCAGWW